MLYLDTVEGNTNQTGDETMRDARERIEVIDRRIAERQRMVDICRSIGDVDGVHCHQRVITSLHHMRMDIHDHQIAPIQIGCPI